ncbi:MAG: hypothetical protein FRX49_03822 [Trebouxia sp. A1-2]|nr:MAG: hypothetical protein FRX49_03822 [Trebouxia sp. A1-2]
MAAEEQRKKTWNDEGRDLGHVQQLRWEQMVFQMGADGLSDGSRSSVRREQIAFQMGADCLLDRSRLPFRRDKLPIAWGADDFRRERYQPPAPDDPRHDGGGDGDDHDGHSGGYHDG